MDLPTTPISTLADSNEDISRSHLHSNGNGEKQRNGAHEEGLMPLDGSGLRSSVSSPPKLEPNPAAPEIEGGGNSGIVDKSKEPVQLHPLHGDTITSLADKKEEDFIGEVERRHQHEPK